MAGIVLSADIDSKGFIAQSRKLLNAISSMQRAAVRAGSEIKRSAGGFGMAMRQTAEQTSLFSQMIGKTESTVRNLTETLAQMGRTRIYSNQYVNLSKQIERAEKRAQSLQDRMAKAVAQGKDKNQTYVRLGDDIKRADEELVKFKADRDRFDAEAQRINDVLKTGLNPSTGKMLNYDEYVAYHSQYESLLGSIKKLDQEIPKLQRKRDSMVAKRDDMEKNGQTVSASYQSMQYDYDQASDRLDELIHKRQILQDMGLDGIDFSETEQYQQLKDILDAIIDRYNDLVQTSAQALKPPDVAAWEQMKTLSGMVAEGLGRIEFAAGIVGQAASHPLQAIDRVLGAVASRAFQAASSLARIAGNAALSYIRKLAAGAKNAAIQLAKLAGNAIQTGLRKIGDLANDAGKRLLGLGKSARKSGNGFNMSFKNVLRYGLGIRSTFVLINRLRKALIEAFGTLAKKFPEFNKSMSQIVTSFNRLKGSFGAAFAPIVTAVAPYLSMLMNMLSDAMTQISKFFAVLLGQKYYYKASAVYEDYAKSVDKSTKSTKKAAKAQEEENRQLAAFDELNILSDKNNSSTSPTASANSGADFTRVPLTGVSDWLQMLKDGNYDDIGKFIAEKINGIFEKVNNFIKWDNIGDTITKYINGFCAIVNSIVDNINWELIGETVGNGIQSLINSFELLLTGINWGNIGTGLGTSLNSLMDKVDWEQLGSVISARLRAKLDLLKGVVMEFNWGEAGTHLAEVINGLLDQKTFDSLGDFLYNGIKGAIEAMQNFVANFEWGKAGGHFSSVIDKLINLAHTTNLGETLRNLLSGAFEMMKEALNFDWGTAGEAFAKNLQDFFSRDREGNIWDGAASVINEAIKGVFDFVSYFQANFDPAELGKNVRKFLTEDIDWSNIASEAWTVIKTAFRQSGEFLDALLGDDIPETVDSIYLPERNTDSKATSWASGFAKGLGRALEYAFNTIVDLAKIVVDSFDAAKFTNYICDFLEEINWGQIALKIIELLVSAMGKLDTVIQTGIYRAFGIEDPDEQQLKNIEKQFTQLRGYGSFEGRGAGTEMSTLKGIYDAVGREWNTDEAFKIVYGRTSSEFFSEFVTDAIKGGEKALPYIPEALAPVEAKMLSDTIDPFGDSITNQITRSIENGLGKVQNITGKVWSVFDDTVNDFTIPFDDGIDNSISSIDVSSLQDELSDKISKITDMGSGDDFTIPLDPHINFGNSSISKFISDINNGITNVKNGVKPITFDVFDVNGINNIALDAADDIATSIHTALTDKVLNSPKLNSMITYSPPLVLGFNGSSLQSGIDKINAAIYGALSDVKENAESGEYRIDPVTALLGGTAFAEELIPDDVVIVKTDNIRKSLVDLANTSKSAMNGISGRYNKMSSTIITGASNVSDNATKSMVSFLTSVSTNTKNAETDAKTNMSNMESDTLAKLASMTLQTSVQTLAMKLSTQQMSNDIKNSTADAFNTMQRHLSAVGSAIRVTTTSSESNVRNAFTSAANVIRDKMSMVYSSIMDKNWDGIGSKISSGVNSAASKISNKDWYNVGLNVVYGIERGINNGSSSLYYTIQNLANNAIRWTKNMFGIWSPSRVFRDEVGVMLGYGLAEGVEDSNPTVEQSIKAMSAKVTDFAKKAFDIGTVGTNIDFQTPNVAAGSVVPYSIVAEAEISDMDVLTEALETSNDDLANVIIQAFNNATSAIVQAIRTYSGGNQSIDTRSITNAVVDEINRRTRAQGKSPLLI